MIRRLSYIAISVLIISAFCGKALAVKPTTLNELIDIALTYNHDVVYASRSVEITKGNVDIRNLFPPPHFRIEWRGMPPNSFGNSTATMYSISQDIPFPTKLMNKWSILNQESDTARYDYEVNKVSLIKKVKKAYYQYALNDKLVKLENNNYHFLEILYKSELKNYELGYSTQIDLIDTKTKLIAASAAAEEYVTNKYNAFAMLESVNASPNPRIIMSTEGLRGFMEDLPVLYYDQKDIDNIPHITQPMEELKNMAIANNPRYQKLKYEAKIASAAAESAQANYLPDLNIAFYQMDSSIPGMSERRFAMGMDLPWLWGGGVDTSRYYQEYLSKYATYYMAVDEITSNIDGKSNSAFVLYRKLDEYQPLLPLIEKQNTQVSLNYATRYDEPKALEAAYNQFQKVNSAGKTYYEIYLRYIDLILDVEELTGERLW